MLQFWYWVIIQVLSKHEIIIKPHEYILGLSKGDFVLAILQCILIIIFVITLIFSVKATLATNRSVKYQTRPLLGFNVDAKQSLAYHVLFSASNYSNTDSTGIVILMIKYDGEWIESHIDPYNGMEKWDFAAKQEVIGHTDLTFASPQLPDFKKQNDLAYKHVWKVVNEMKEKLDGKIELEMKSEKIKNGVIVSTTQDTNFLNAQIIKSTSEIINFARENKDVENIELAVKLFYWQYNPKCKIPKSKNIHEAPIKRWKFNLEENTWVANPTYKSLEEPFEDVKAYLERMQSQKKIV